MPWKKIAAVLAVGLFCWVTLTVVSEATAEQSKQVTIVRERQPAEPGAGLNASYTYYSYADSLAQYEQQLSDFYAGIQADLDRQAAEEAERQRQREAAARSTGYGAATSPGYHPGTTNNGDCTGFAIPDYIIQRESGGNPSAYNPSGAYGCAQTLLSHYSRGSCQGLDPYTIEGQRECVWILSNGGTNLQPWAATR